MEYLLRGVMVGILFGIPVGAVGALVVQRTWSGGIRAGLLTGLGSSAADCCYAAVGVFGLTVLSEFLLHWQGMITALGGVLILGLGLRSLLAPQAETGATQAGQGGVRLILTSFAIGITNPAAVLTFLFAFSYFGLFGISGYRDGAATVAGVFLGTFFWWILLSALTGLMKKRAARVSLRSVNRVFSAVLCVFGLVVLARMIL